MFPRVAKALPRAGISERLQRYSSQLEYETHLLAFAVSNVFHCTSINIDKNG
jgi:hypothetical protein